MSRHLLLALTLLSLCPCAASAQQPATKASERFQIISAAVTDAGTQPADKVVQAVFLLDTQTGQVWRYFPRVGGLRSLKPQDQYSTENGGTGLLLSPGAWVPVQKIEFADKAATQK